MTSKHFTPFILMATVKVKFKPSTVANHEGTIFYQILHERKQRQHFSSYHVFPSEWDENRSMVTTAQKSERKSFILSIRERIRWDVERLTKIIRKLDHNGLDYSVDDVIDEFNRYANEYSLFNFMESIIIKLRQNGKERTSEAYRSALNSFKRFRDNEDIMLDNITADIMESYESWLQNNSITPNSISFYIRIIRATYNRAVQQDIIESRNPFIHVYTGIEKTKKRALPLKTIKHIRNLDLSLMPSLDFARDMFILSFMLRGMSFIDMAFLRKKDLDNGILMYRRRKTRQLLKIEWTREMQSILDKYPENQSDYLLPIIKTNSRNERNTFKNVCYNVNHNLKKVASKVGVMIPLTLYVARHSWASAAKSKGIPLSVISEGMGHDNEMTTQIYLSSLDTSLVDKANSMIIKSIE